MKLTVSISSSSQSRKTDNRPHQLFPRLLCASIPKDPNTVNDEPWFCFSENFVHSTVTCQPFMATHRSYCDHQPQHAIPREETLNAATYSHGMVDVIDDVRRQYGIEHLVKRTRIVWHLPVGPFDCIFGGNVGLEVGEDV